MSIPPPLPAPPAWPAPPDPPELPDGVVPTSGRPAWPAWSALAVIVAGLGAALAGGLIIVIVGAAFGADPEDPPPSIAIASTVLQDACFIGAVIFFARMRGPVLPWQLGLRRTRVLPAVGWTLLVFGALVAVSAGWAALLDRTQSENLPESLGVDQSTAALVATAVLVTIVAPIAEELLFRAYVFPALRNWKGTWPAVLITGVLFGLLHVASSPAYALLPLAVFGALLCLLYLRTRSLYPCIVLHSLNNCIAFGGAPEVGWDWQILPLAAGALAVLGALALAVRRVWGPAPVGLSAV